MWWTFIGPVLLSLVAAVVAWIVMGARHPRPDRRSARLTGLVVGGAVIVTVADILIAPLSLQVDVPRWLTGLAGDITYALPLVLGLVATALMALPGRSRPGPATAHLAPRTWSSFVPRGWLIALLAGLAVVVALTVAAGAASEPDDQGRYLRFSLDLGSVQAGTQIYGWHLSVIPLALLVLLTGVTWAALWAIACRPLAADSDQDAAVRRLRSTDVVRFATGAVLLHLKAVLGSLASTSMLWISTGAGAEGASTGTSFAALTETLLLTSVLAGIAGLGLWIFTVLTALARPPRSPRTAPRAPQTSPSS